MNETVLQIKGLHAGIEEKQILHNIALEIGRGEVHILMGPNGAGKSSLGQVLMGNPKYQVTSGTILLKGEDITEESAEKRAQAGMFLSFQEPLEIAGISLESFLRTAVEKRTGKRIPLWDFRKEMKQTMELLQMNPAYAQRDLNVGFSGGEKKKAEILQLLMLKPDFAILDETDSGLDVDAVRVVAAGIQKYREETQGALLIITHSTRILDTLMINSTHIMADGKLVITGDGSLVQKINKQGFEACLSDALS